MSRFYIWMIFLLLSDLGTKAWAERHLLPGKKIQINDLLSFALVRNKGIGFGLFASDRPIVYILEFIGVIAVTLFLYVLRGRHRLLESTAQILIISGAAGNLLNRVISGYVIDFIMVKPYPFIFNVADVEIRSGLILLTKT